MKIKSVIKGVCYSLAIIFLFIGAILLGVFVGKVRESFTKLVPLYKYEVHLYYLGGSERNIVIESLKDPYITSYKGSYSLRWYDSRDYYEEKGVVRREILSKKKIKDVTW